VSLKAKIEAMLFLTEKPLKALAIARTVNEDVQVVRQNILELINDYESRDGGLEIADDDGYMIQVKDQYTAIIDEFLPLDLPVALLRTLSAIAIKQPVNQSDVIKIRGAGAYDHVKELLARGLIHKKDGDGRSPMLTTTKEFQDYFRLTQDAKVLRTELRKDKKKGDEATTFDATPVNDNESTRLVVQLKLGEEDAREVAEKMTTLTSSLPDTESDEAAPSDSEAPSTNTVATPTSSTAEAEVKVQAPAEEAWDAPQIIKDDAVGGLASIPDTSGEVRG
jgi:segregation and condensation protein B